MDLRSPRRLCQRQEGMMTLENISSNIAALQQKDPDLVARIGNFRSSGLYRKAVDSRGRDVLLYNDGRREIALGMDAVALYPLDLTDPGSEKPIRILLFYGLGIGEHFDKFIRQSVATLQAIIVIERSMEAFMFFLAQSDHREIIASSDILWCIEDNQDMLWHRLVEFFTTEPHFFYLNTIHPVQMPSSISIDCGYYIAAAATVKKATDFTVETFGTSPNDQMIGTRNILENVVAVNSAIPLEHLKDSCKDLPGLLIATGPSLNDVFPFLPEWLDHTIVLCCDSALYPCITRRIVPDAVVSLERYPELIDFFRNYHLPENLHLFALPLQNPELISMFRDRLIVTQTKMHLNRYLFPQLERFYLGPTVSTYALNALIVMGCNPIVIVGNDLAYDTSTGSTHGSDVLINFDKALNEEKGAIIQVEGNADKMVTTKPVWNFFRQETERILKKTDTCCYNAIPKEKGIRINGLIQIEPSVVYREILADKPVLGDRKRFVQHRHCQQAPTIRSVEAKLRAGITALQRIETMTALVMKAINEADPDIAAIESSINEIFNKGPLFYELLSDIILPLHLRYWNLYYEIPAKEDRQFRQRKITILRQWSEELIRWIAPLSEQLHLTIEMIRHTDERVQ